MGAYGHFKHLNKLELRSDTIEDVDVQEIVRDIEKAAAEPLVSADDIRDMLVMMKEGFLDNLGISLRALSRHTGIPKGRLQKIFAGKGPHVTPDETAILRAAFDHYDKTLVKPIAPPKALLPAVN